MPRECDGNGRGVGVGTGSQDGGRLMDTTTGILADKKQGQFVPSSRPPPLPRLPLCPHLPCVLLSAAASIRPSSSEILVFLLGAGG